MAARPVPRAVRSFVRAPTRIRAEARFRAPLRAGVHVARHPRKPVELQAGVAAHRLDADGAYRVPLQRRSRVFQRPRPHGAPSPLRPNCAHRANQLVHVCGALAERTDDEASHPSEGVQVCLHRPHRTVLQVGERVVLAVRLPRRRVHFRVHFRLPSLHGSALGVLRRAAVKVRLRIATVHTLHVGEDTDRGVQLEQKVRYGRLALPERLSPEALPLYGFLVRKVYATCTLLSGLYTAGSSVSENREEN